MSDQPKPTTAGELTPWTIRRWKGTVDWFDVMKGQDDPVVSGLSENKATFICIAHNAALAAAIAAAQVKKGE